MLRRKEPFTFSKFADGEWSILDDRPIDTRSRHNGEFKYDPADMRDAEIREDLIDALQHREDTGLDNYYVGVGCPCCMPTDYRSMLRTRCEGFNGEDEPEARTTFANIWVNGNYQGFRTEVMPLFEKFSTVSLVCNQKADPEKLPFRVDSVYRVGTNAWREDYGLSRTLPKLGVPAGEQDTLFLFACGPLGNLLAYRMNYCNPHNTYLDIGSTLDPFMFPGKRGLTRRYLSGGQTSMRTCTWKSL